jgi:anhydro-N-acetylmuramic acid kinase
MHTRWIIGLASGSSLTGVEAALVEVSGAGLEMRLRLIQSSAQTYPRDLGELLARVASGSAAQPRHTSLVHRLLGETYAAVARQVAEQARMSLAKIDGLGFTGPTIGHDTEGRFPATLSLGMAAAVAERTGLTAFSDFRARDVIAGGNGFPLTPVIDFLLFHHPEEHRVLVHLGGMATLVSLPPGGQLRRVHGVQAAPCNLLLDELMKRLTGGRESFDLGGRHAVQGRCIEPLLQRWLAQPVLQRRPPRLLPPQAFGEDFVLQAVQQARANNWSLHDLLCTASHFVARSISAAMARFVPEPPTRVLLSGGGARNGFLWHLLGQQLGQVPVEKTDDHGIPGQACQAVTAAGLAALVMDGIPGNHPAATGASGARLLGQITPGSSANWARCLGWMAAQSAPLVRLAG